MYQHSTEQMKDEARRTGQQTREEINQAVEDTKQKGKELVGDAKQEASKMAEQQQQNVAHQIDGLAQALTKTADNLDLNEDQAWIANGTRQTAQALDKMSTSLRERDFNTIVRDVENYTREQPTVVLGGAVLAGFLLSRFLKSSENRRSVEAEQAYPSATMRNDIPRNPNDDVTQPYDTTRRL